MKQKMVKVRRNLRNIKKKIVGKPLKYYVVEQSVPSGWSHKWIKRRIKMTPSAFRQHKNWITSYKKSGEVPKEKQKKMYARKVGEGVAKTLREKSQVFK